MIPRFTDFASSLLESSNADLKKVYDQVREWVTTARLHMEVSYQGEEVAIVLPLPRSSWPVARPNSWDAINAMMGDRVRSKWTERNDGKYANVWGDAIVLPKKSFDRFMAGLKAARVEVENPRATSKVILMRSWEDVDAVLRAIDAA